MREVKDHAYHNLHQELRDLRSSKMGPDQQGKPASYVI